MKFPLFPLNTLVCPKGKLPLRIFETRYMDMVSRCLRDGSGFVVVMLVEGDETQVSGGDGKDIEEHADDVSKVPAVSLEGLGPKVHVASNSVSFYQLGTYCNIVDFDAGEQGMLNIVTQADYRVLIEGVQQDESGLWWGHCQPVEDELPVLFPDEYLELVDVLKALVSHPLVQGLNTAIDFSDCRQVGWRLTELLPLSDSDKQLLLELLDPVDRLEKISDRLDRMSS